MVMAKEKFDYDFSSWGNLRREVGNYHIIFWSMTSKAEFSSGSPDQFLYICHVASLIRAFVLNTR